MNTPLVSYLRAGYPALALITPEEARAEAELAAACSSLDRSLHVWSSTEGLIHLDSGEGQSCADPFEALAKIESLFAQYERQHVVMLRDFQPYFERPDPSLVRRLKDLLRLAKAGGNGLVLVGCRCKLPPELEHEFTLIELPLPGDRQLSEVLEGILAAANLGPLCDVDRDPLVRAAAGMTTIEAENAFALSLIECGGLNPAIVSREKATMLKQNGLLEVIAHQPALEEVGGLRGLKDWLLQRSQAFGKAAAEYGLPSPKGVLIVGIPGTGKSLTAKATAAVLGLPLLRLDIGRVFGGIVGQSEANLRSVIQIAEAIAPCVLWIDEVEKGFGRSGGGSSDGGTSARVFGSFLSWMQEKSQAVFVTAAANDVSKLPPEFLRKGRFDEMFFVDLPDAAEREEIWSIVISRYRRRPAEFDLTVLANLTRDFTGAEIEAAFCESLHHAFSEAREPVTADLKVAISATTPLARLMAEKIEALRAWSQGRGRKANQSPSAGQRPRLQAPSRRIRASN